MKILKINLHQLFFLILLLCGNNILVPAQNISFTDTIPYEVVQSKMLIEISLNGRPAKFILDTGGRNMILRDSTTMDDVKITRREDVSETNGLSVGAYRGTVKNLKIGKYMGFNDIEVLVMPQFNFFKKLGVSGTLGAEAFKDVVLMIKSKEQVLIITYPYRPKSISRKDGLEMEVGKNRNPFISLQVGKENLYAMFDTGFNHFLTLSEKDAEIFNQKENIRKKEEITGAYFLGVGGRENTETHKTGLYQADAVAVGSKLFLDVNIITRMGGRSIVGKDLLEYGDVMLDFPRHLFYFFPFDDSIEGMKEKTKIWNINILPSGKDNGFIVAGVIGKPAVEVGEKIWNINGENLEGLPLDDEYITKILDRITTDEFYIMVGKTKDQIRKVLINKL